VTAHEQPALMRPILAAGALIALLGVMAGAFGAHGLRALVDARGLEVFQTAVNYQIVHAFALVLVAILAGMGLSRPLLKWAAGFYLTGILLFCGSLYLLVLSDLRWPGPVTPVGGVCFMVGWALLVAAALRRESSSGGA
jgi:uncharacterized membrane protein YgdD (TMEM256/DUF423 family)